MDSFVESLYISTVGPVAKYLLARGSEFKSSVLCLLLFHAYILGSLGSNLVFIIPFGIM
jgi:hypothetical protein